MKRRRSMTAATTLKGDVDASEAPCVSVELDGELRRSARRERREKRAKRKEATKRKRLKGSSSRPDIATPTPEDRSLTKGEGGASWAGGCGEERAKETSKKLKATSPCFETQFEAPSKPAKESRKTRTRKSKSTSPHFHIKVKGTKKDPEISAQTIIISKPLKTKPNLKGGETSGIKKTKNRKTTSPLKTLSTLQAENIPQTQSKKVKRSKSTSPRLETKIENTPATKKARSKKSKSSSPHFDIKPEKTPGEILINHTDDPPKGTTGSAEEEVVRCLEQSEEGLGTEAKEKKKRRKQRSKEEAVAAKNQERKERKIARRVQAGISTAIWPLLSSDRFGLIQEELKGDPFHLIVGTTFLNRTRGSVAIPLLRQFLRDYPAPYALSIAPVHTISVFLQPLGLYNIRATRLHNLAKTWLTTPPTFGHVTKKYNYPPRDTKPFPSSLFPTNGVEQGRGWEIAHLPGVGAYALDSWRIFCRDEFRRAAGERVELGQEEWRSVVPMDKELRVYVRWMWAKEGVKWKEPGDIKQTALSSPFFDGERAAIS